MSENNKSILKFSSEYGVWMGAYLFCMSACLLLSVRVPAMILPLLPLVLGWPVVLYFLLRRVWAQVPAYRTLSAMWLGGIWICIFGSLICAALSAAWILLFEPDFLMLYLQQCVEIGQKATLSAEYAQMAAQIEALVKAGHVPSAMSWIFSMIWLTAFAGALLSLAVAALMTVRRSSNPNKFP